jgi:predicted DNA-binding ArsR family transcriptional regulator
MKRIKVINELTDLVALLRAMDTPVKKKVFQEATESWITTKGVEERHGEEGVEALTFFEKMHLVETSWQIDSEFNKEKIYHSYYVSVHLNTSAPITEVSDVLYIAAMPELDFKELEQRIFDRSGKEGIFSGDLSKDLDLTPIMLKSLVKRSGRLAYKGHRIERATSES